MRKLKFIVAVLVAAMCLSLNSYAAVVIGDWENMPTSGDGWIDWGGGEVPIETLPAQYQPGAIGVTLGSQSLKLIKNGWAQTLAIKLQDHGYVDDFLANTKIEFDWAAPNLNDDGGWNKIENVTLNAPNWGWQALPNSTFMLGFWAGSGTLSMHVAIDYSAALPIIGPTPSHVELILTTNNDSVHNEAYFDNFQLTPEPTTIALLGLGSLALLRRKRA